MTRPRMALVALMLVVSVLGAVPNRAVAGEHVLNVPGHFATIVEAVAAAGDGDTVRVAAGTYQELVIVDGKDVSIVAPAGYRETGIEGGVVFRNGADGELRGFRVQYSYTGVSIEQSSPRLEDNWIIENAGGGGVRIEGPAAPVLERNIIANNWGCEEGSGIGVRDAAPIIRNNWIAANRAQLHDVCIGGGIIVGGESGARIVGNRIENNYANGAGAAIYAYGDVVIKNNMIRLNFSTPLFGDASAVSIASAGSFGTTVRLTRNVVIDNDGIGIDLQVERAGLVVVSNNLIVDNRAESHGAGVTASVVAEAGVQQTAKYRIVNNTIANNEGAAAIWTHGFHQKSRIRNNVVLPAEGFPALECSTLGNRDHEPPLVDHNDLWAPAGLESTGRCPDLVGANGNFAADPEFDDPDVGFRPLAGSPLIDAGSDIGVPAVDQAGYPRPFDGDGNGSAVTDIGAYEYQIPTCRGEPATIVGTRGSDQLAGTDGVDVVVAYEGDDYIQGFAGDDIICAGPGDDGIEGGPGSDYIRGGSGGDYLDGGEGHDFLVGGAGKIGGAGIDIMFGGAGDDELRGKADHDIIEGGDGNDVIRGGRGDDDLHGRPGNDTLFGGPGADTLRGGQGVDSLDGGAGQDSCSGEVSIACEGPV